MVRGVAQPAPGHLGLEFLGLRVPEEDRHAVDGEHLERHIGDVGQELIQVERARKLLGDIEQEGKLLGLALARGGALDTEEPDLRR